MNVDCLRCFILKEAERDMELRGRPSTVGFCLNVEQESRSMLKIRVELGLKEYSKRFNGLGTWKNGMARDTLKVIRLFQELVEIITFDLFHHYPKMFNSIYIVFVTF